jgi:HlyD family secretion protein
MSRRISLHRRPWVWALLVTILTAGVVVTLIARAPRVPVAVIVRGDLEQHLVASGRVMPAARIEAAALTTGLVTRVGPREGDAVKIGELLVQLDEAESQSQIAQAEAAVAQARARAEQVGSVASAVASAGLEQATATFENARQQFERVQKLVETGAASQQDLDDARRARDVARAQRDSAQAQRIGSGARGVEARMAWAALSQAHAQLALARLRLIQTRVVAPQDAIVLSRSVEPGSVVSPGHTLFTLSAVGPTRLSVQLDERDLSYLKLGQVARASADAFPDQIFNAEVNYIAPSIDSQRGTVEVRLRVPAPPASLRPDMTVSVDLLVARRARVRVVPFEAVHGLATPRPWALVVQGGHARRRDLKLGIRGEGSVEVTHGLAEGDTVVLPDGQAITAGRRVRPVLREP